MNNDLKTCQLVETYFRIKKNFCLRLRLHKNYKKISHNFFLCNTIRLLHICIYLQFEVQRFLSNHLSTVNTITILYYMCVTQLFHVNRLIRDMFKENNFKI